MTTIEEEQAEWYKAEASRIMYDAVHAAVEAEELFEKGLEKEGCEKLDELDSLHAQAVELDRRLAKDMERWAVSV